MSSIQEYAVSIANTAYSVAVFLLDHNGAEDTLEAVRSVIEENPENLMIYVLINGSDSESQARLANQLLAFSTVETHVSPVNLGFTGGHNHLLRILKDLKVEQNLS